MIDKVFQSAAVSLLLSCASICWGAPAELRGAQLSATASAAQLTLDIAGVTSQKLFTLDNPSRTVVDLVNTRVSGRFRVPAGSGLITSIRTGHQPGGTLRLVIRMRAGAVARSSWVPAAGRGRRQLVITFGDPRAAAAAASATTASSDATPHVVRAPHAPQDSDRDVIVAVDAGHGGDDPGATGRNGTHEKDVVLAIARTLADRINGEPGMRAVLTRNRDEFIVLRDRIRRARLAKADMFVSVHADSIANRDVTGASVYVLSERGASNEAARWLAERENAADLMGGVSLDDKDNTLASVLLDLSQSANISASMTAAQRVLGALDHVGQVRKSEVQQAGFVVLKSPDIPSMLVETAYISNPGEELRLRNPRQQALLADAIFSGVRSYFEQNPPAGTRFAQVRRSTVASVMAAPATP